MEKVSSESEITEGLKRLLYLCLPLDRTTIAGAKEQDLHRRLPSGESDKYCCRSG